MRFVDEFRDPEAARHLVHAIAELAEGAPHRKLMEVCGGHTHTIYRHGLEQLLPANVELVHGPGCPVCVIPMGRVDDAIHLAERPGVIFTSFGDMMRVPGSGGDSLLAAKARGADVRMVYSPLDALEIARAEPDREVVFFAVGFETTAPSTAVTLVRAKALGVTNFTAFSNHVVIGPPLQAILTAPDLDLHGFIGPGHVSTVIGTLPYRFVAEEHGKPVVVTGFEPLDILQAVRMLLTQFAEGRCEVENQYTRVVREEGNPRALALLDRVFTLRPHFEWRGMGSLPDSGYGLSEEFADLDAERRFDLPGVRVADPAACQCGEVLVGAIRPWECKVFGTACTPETPIGTCMVSSEGACAAFYTFGRSRHVAVGDDVTALPDDVTALPDGLTAPLPVV
jgi:hydrogenase expression/formation protein HypD